MLGIQIKHIWTLHRPALESTLSEFSDKCQSKLYRTWAGGLANMFNSWDSTWIECRDPAKACEPNPWLFHPVIQNQIFLFEIGHRLWAVLAPKVAEIRIWFWCMLMLGLGSTLSRLSPDYTPLLTPASVRLLLLSEDRSVSLMWTLPIAATLVHTCTCKPLSLIPLPYNVHV